MQTIHKRFNIVVFPLNVANLALFGYIWLMVGFSTGFSVLMGPTRWVTSYAREHGLGEDAESLAVRAIIVLFVASSFAVSLLFARAAIVTDKRHIRLLIPLLCTVAASGTLWLNLNPALLAEGRGTEVVATSRFTFGPYPGEERLRELEAEGYTAVVSLLHPAIVPFEPRLLAEERATISETGMELIHAPMLPWVGDNKESLDIIRVLAESGEGRYYVHCYLGRDRIRLAQRIVESVSPEIATAEAQSQRTKEARSSLERGLIIDLGDGSFLSPYPTDEEFASYVLNGNFGRVIAILDPEDAGDRPWIEKEREILSSYSMRFEVKPIPKGEYDPQEVLEIARRVRGSGDRVLVHAFRSDSARARAFVTAYQTDLPPLRARAFKEPMENGKTVVLAPNLAAGPRPEAPEFGNYLYSRGIRGIGYLGAVNSVDPVDDEALAREAGLEWRSVSNVAAKPQAVFEEFESGGPWYIYGPEMPDLGIAHGVAFERGVLVTLEDGVYVGPYPTDGEFQKRIIGGGIRHVVSLLDPGNAADAAWVERERKLLADTGVILEIMPISPMVHDADSVLLAARRVRELPRPVLVHAFQAGTPRVQAFIQAYRSNLPPLPPGLFGEAMERGAVTVAAPNVVYGPRPIKQEFDAYLFNRGVRNILYLGDAESLDATEDQRLSQSAGLNWQTYDVRENGRGVLQVVARGGPWYLYGPSLSLVEDRIESRLGPALPVRMIRFSTGSSAVDSRKKANDFDADGVEAGSGLLSYLRSALSKAIPDAQTTVLLAPALLVYTWLTAYFVGWLKRAKGMRTPYTRKIFHFITFTAATVLQITLGLSAVALFGGILTLAVAYGLYRKRELSFYDAIARPTDEPHGGLFVVLPLISVVAGGVIGNLVFGQLAAIGYMVVGWGDAVGEPVGTRWGKHRYRVPSFGKVKITRSLEGSLAVAIVGAVAASLALLGLGFGPTNALRVGVLCGLAGAAVEAISSHGTDNFTVQVAASAVPFVL